MEMSLASSFVRYIYIGKRPIVFDDHNDDYELEVATDDVVSIRVTGSKVEIRPSDSTEIFIATTSDPKYVKLMKFSTPDEFVFVPHPKKPNYPFIPKVTFDMLPKLYEYLNDKYFNGMCPKKLLFKRSTAQAFLGLAQIDPNVRGKQLYRMTVNMKRISQDTLLFVDVLLHEMIHLYLFRKGLDENNMAYYNDGHGPFFQAEMARLNKHGFNIDIVLKWEQREISDNVELHVIRVTSPQTTSDHTKYFWSDRDLTEDFDRIVAQFVNAGLYGDMLIQLLATKSSSVRTFPQITQSGKVPASKIKLWYNSIKFPCRVLKEFNTADQPKEVVRSLNLKVPKKEEPYYAQSFQLFVAYMKRVHGEHDETRLQSMWHSFPIKKIIPHAEAELLDIAKGIKRGLSDAETKRKLTNVFARFDDRYNQYEYRKTINDILDKHKLDQLRYYPQLGL